MNTVKLGCVGRHHRLLFVGHINAGSKAASTAVSDLSFQRWQVYARMPFDRHETIKTMGTKLFTRIKDGNERRLIRDFLAQE
ncbi:MAG: hypothetical protein ABJC10_08085 [Acidobacteriota bacterium]